MMEQQADAGFKAEVFGSENGEVLGNLALKRVRDLVVEFFAALFHRKVLPHFADPFAVKRLVQRDAVKVIAHERRYFTERSHSAERAVAFDQEHVRSLPGRHHRGADSAGAAPDNRYVSFRNDRNRFVIPVIECFHKTHLHNFAVIGPLTI